tara:strand:+ start:227 stop:682 length:456 start_codon:yes stop_codon:yes gene_type:complete
MKYLDACEVNIHERAVRLRELTEMVSTGEIIVKESNWDIDEMSKFIESILLRIPIPNVYIDETEDFQKTTIIWNNKLIYTITAFMTNKFRISMVKFEGYKNIVGLTYSELGRHIQRRFEEMIIRVYSIVHGTSLPVSAYIRARIRQMHREE